MHKGLLASLVTKGDLYMKKTSVIIALLLTTFSGLSSLSYAGAEVSGHGAADGCDTAAYNEAKHAADQDAAQKCAEKVTPISDYTTWCEQFAGGRVKFAEASAEYSCGN
jgi:hypothetical protein